jgi:uncharacterized membrane protein
MTGSPNDQRHPVSDLPFVAPCRKLSPQSPIKWLSLGWRDLRAAPLPSLSYGFALTLLSGIVVLATWKVGTLALYLGLASGFVFFGPLLAMGLYSISRELEAKERPSFWFSWREGRSHLKDMLVIGICLLVVMLVWGRAATLMNVFRPSLSSAGWSELIPYLGIGSAVGALFCAIVFAASAFSFPMLVDRSVDGVTAVITSINATLRNKLAMVVWAALIGVVVLIGFASCLIGFVVLLPLIGHATWHAYRETIDASAWPDHRNSL